jgi:hypothetical protein
LLLLKVGVATALAVAGLAVVSWAMLVLSAQWDRALSAGIAAYFVAANLVWAMSGVAWSQRLRRRYAEVAGHPFDGLPVLLLFVAVVLATSATCATVSL